MVNLLLSSSKENFENFENFSSFSEGILDRQEINFDFRVSALKSILDLDVKIYFFFQINKTIRIRDI